KMETVEHFAKISLVARQLGNENVFSPARAEELVESRARYGVQAGGGCRIEYKDASYAPEVAMTGTGGAAYAADNVNARGATNAPSSKGSNGGEIDLSEDELKAVVREVTRRIIEKMG